MTKYIIDPGQSRVTFNLKHMMFAKVHGKFEKLSGKLSYDPLKPDEIQVEANIETNSINTRDSQRDAHLRSVEFFNVKKYPTINFISRQVVPKNSELLLIGDLTIHGVTQSVTVNVQQPSEETKDTIGNVKIGFLGTAKIKRKDFGLTWNAALEAGGLLVGDEVNINLDVQFIKHLKTNE
jgi:polyisoprenoid-binding protein YceI